MKRISAVALSFIILLSACNEKKEVPAADSKKVEDKKEEGTKVINDIEYKLLFFKGYERDKDLEEYYLDEIEMYSNYMDSEIGNLLIKNSEVLVSFKPGKGHTQSGPGFIDIYVDEEEYYEVNAGAIYRSNYKEVTATKGSFAPNYIISEYFAVKYESELDSEFQYYATFKDVANARKNLDIQRLWNDQAFLHSYNSNWEDYIDSISFVDYLMKTYGKETTLTLVTENDNESINIAFGKNLDALIKDWKQAK
ncbi:hypothetical protein [Fictibacillus phosphorivorans]|uniref:hypothetical protein n=1 Tax=Fictibacillus phosphorivorans TaxID=1221500 RepID=UPI0012930943|nr:hypothetical protein [Fictibacillus phosphorivorans]MQR94781.1 hypothetical protein [Fictibacillus phosphorivorans]